MADYSASPTGEKFELPQPEEYAQEFQRLEALVQAARDEGKEIVVVMGVGFVGAVMAAIIGSTCGSSALTGDCPRLSRGIFQ